VAEPHTSMKLTFLGTGTSMGVPIAGGFGPFMPIEDPRDERFRTSAWIQTEKTSIVIDTSPEFRLQTLRAGIKHIDLVLVTHEHMDHIAGLDDLRSFCYVQDQVIPVYSQQRTLDSIRKRFDYMFGPNRYPGAVRIGLNELIRPMTYQDCVITPIPVSHGNMDILGYRINDLVYITDAKSIPAESLEIMKGAKLMVLNGLRWSPEHPTHMTIPEAVDVATQLEIPDTYLVHMNGFVNHGEITEKLPDHVHLAFDQLEVAIP
jgi:phosphoribosyl 1,2-cyclic phosphate phosphodiesterase